MNRPNDDEPDSDPALRALFDRTARTPTEAERGRLAARAANVAASGRRERLRARLVWPLALAAAAAVAYLVAIPDHRKPPALPPAPAAAPTPPEVAVEEPKRPPEAPPESAYDAEDPVVEVFGGEPEDLDLTPLLLTSDADRRETALEAADEAAGDAP